MGHSSTILKAVEQLDYRVTVGDVAAKAGLSLQTAQQGVLALASDVSAHIQVSEAGEVAYVFPRNLQAILLSKSWQLRWQSAWRRIWGWLSYLIRISFGVLLVLSLLLISIAIIILVVAINSSQQRDDRDGGGFGGGMIFLPRFWIGPDFYWIFAPDYRRRQHASRSRGREDKMNFFEAVFSFLFGDGNPNADLEERRWQAIASIIRNHQGVVVAEQIAPFLDDLGQGWSQENEDYMLPVLSRFDGRPQVSRQGGLVYHFPELQVMAEARHSRSVPKWLQELPRHFSQATSGQIMAAVGLGGANLVGALVLGSLLQDQMLVAQLGGLVAFVNSIYWILLAYGVAFLAVPLGRYFWVQRQNRKINARNQQREARVEALLSPSEGIQEKLAFAASFAGQTIVDQSNLAYTTERDLTEQEAEKADQIDAEWRQLLRDSQD